MRLILFLSMVSRLEAGSVFPTFEHFLETFNAYCHANKELFVRKNTVTVEAANKTIKREEKKFPAAWVYKAIINIAGTTTQKGAASEQRRSKQI